MREYANRKENINKFIENKKFKFVYHDINEFFYEEIDEIYNLACPASPVQYQADPIQTFKSSVIGSLNLLELAKKNKCKIFHASTSEIYGDPNKNDIPTSENYRGNVSCIGPRSCYDESKRVILYKDQEVLLTSLENKILKICRHRFQSFA